MKPVKVRRSLDNCLLKINFYIIMPKKIIEAEIKTSSGTEIKLKGNTDDVAKVVGLFADQKTDKNKLEIEREI